MSFGCYHRLPRAARQSYKFTSLVYKTPTVGALGRGQSCTLVVEKEAMAPHTVDGFACGTAHGVRIHHGNPKSANVDELVPTFVFSHNQVLHPRALNPVAYG